VTIAAQLAIVSRTQMRLTALAVASFFLAGCNVRCNANLGDGASPTPMAATGSEVWTIEGKAWRIEATYYLARPEGLQFTVETPVEKVPAVEVLALDEAWPLIRHAYLQQLYLRTKLRAFGADGVSATRIGVSLFHREGASTRGMRVAMSLGQIRDRLESEKRKTSI